MSIIDAFPNIFTQQYYYPYPTDLKYEIPISCYP